MRIALIGFLIAACSLNGETKGPQAAGAPVRRLTLKMKILEIKETPNHGLRISAKAASDTDHWGLVINIPGGKFKKEDETPPGYSWYRFPVLLEPTADGRASLDMLLSTTLRKGAPATLFKPRGYAGNASSTPKQLGRKGGRLTLFDPGIDGETFWDIEIELDVRQRSLSLVVCNAAYR